MRGGNDIHSIFAVILPVSLGLGLIYLYVMGEMDAWAAIMAILGMLALVPVVGLVANAITEGRLHAVVGRSRRKSRAER